MFPGSASGRLLSAGDDGRHGARAGHSNYQAIRPDCVTGRTTPRADSLCFWGEAGA